MSKLAQNIALCFCFWLLNAHSADATLYNFFIAVDGGYSRSGPVLPSTLSFTLDTANPVPDTSPYLQTYLDLAPIAVTVVSGGVAITTQSVVPVLQVDQPPRLGFLMLRDLPYGFYATYGPPLVTLTGNEITFPEGIVAVAVPDYVARSGTATISKVSTAVPEPGGFGSVLVGLTIVGIAHRRRLTGTRAVAA